MIKEGGGGGGGGGKGHYIFTVSVQRHDCINHAIAFEQNYKLIQYDTNIHASASS